MGFGLPVESWERFLLVMDSGLPIESWERFCCMDSGLPIESWERFRWMDSGLPIELWEHFLLVKDLGLPNRVVAGYDTCHCLVGRPLLRYSIHAYYILLFVRRHVRAF